MKRQELKTSPFFNFQAHRSLTLTLTRARLLLPPYFGPCASSVLRQARVVAVYINVNVNGRVRRRARGAERNPREAASGSAKAADYTTTVPHDATSPLL